MSTHQGNSWVTFDCFGTLVDWNSGFSELLRPIAGKQSARLLAAYHQFERQIEAQRPHRHYRDVLASALALAAQKVHVALPSSQALALPRAWTSLPVFGDVEPALAALRSAGYKLGVLTNCDDDLFEQTQRCFQRCFNVVVTAEQVQDYKPSLSHFLFFAKETSVVSRK
ncbi:HAD family hydrolase (fragment) [Verrucomicrobia bacterium]